MHLALGGCLGLPPIRYGLTADTGGHIRYVLGAAMAQATRSRVEKVSIVTRLFEDDRLGAQFARPTEHINGKITVDRIATNNRAYLEKAALSLDLPAFAEAFCYHIGRLSKRPDIIHAHFADASYAAAIARKQFGIPFVYTPHALGIDKQKQSISDDGLGGRIAAEHRAIAAADAIIVSSQNEADMQVAAYTDSNLCARIQCIAPGAAQHAVRSNAVTATGLLTPHLAAPGKPIVLAIARPVRKKNLRTVIRAFVHTPALVESANLVILAGQHGSGLLCDEEKEVVAELKALCRGPALIGRVALPPTHDAQDVATLYRKASCGGVFVNPALHEPFGLTLLEAAAAGVPVVATRNGGTVDIVAAIEHGLLVDPCDEQAIGTACLHIVTDPGLHRRFSSAGRFNIRKFSWAKYAESSLSLYESICQKPHRPAPVLVGGLTQCGRPAASVDSAAA